MFFHHFVRVPKPLRFFSVPVCNNGPVWYLELGNTLIGTLKREFKGIYLSKALTCMKFFLYKQKLLFYQGDR